MGLDPSILHKESIARLLSPAERKKAGVKTQAEAESGAVAKSERELQCQLVSLLSRNGVRFVINQRFGVKTTAPVGTPDILFVLRSQPHAWEVKLPGQKPRPEQVKAMEGMISDGWHCSVVTSYDQGLGLLRAISA